LVVSAISYSWRGRSKKSLSAVGAGFLWTSACHAIELWQICLIPFAEAGCALDGFLNVICFGGETGMDILRSHSGFAHRVRGLRSQSGRQSRGTATHELLKNVHHIV
jgi:hypothetical protein